MNIILESLCGTQHLESRDELSNNPHIHIRYALCYRDPIDLLPLPQSNVITNLGRYGDGYVYLVQDNGQDHNTPPPAQLLFFSMNKSAFFLTDQFRSIRARLIDFDGGTPFVVGFDVKTPEGWEKLHAQAEVWTDADIDYFHTRAYRVSVSLNPCSYDEVVS